MILNLPSPFLTDRTYGRSHEFSRSQGKPATSDQSVKLERRHGFEPRRRVWKTPMLPLHQHRSELVAGVGDEPTEVCL